MKRRGHWAPFWLRWLLILAIIWATIYGLFLLVKAGVVWVWDEQLAHAAERKPDRPDRLRLGPRQGADSTSYCLRGAMSDGTYTRHGSVAVLPGRHRLGTLIRLDRRVRVPGDRPRRYFRVRDHIGHGSQLDIWSPSCWWSTNRWGRKHVTYRVVTRRIPRR